MESTHDVQIGADRVTKRFRCRLSAVKPIANGAHCSCWTAMLLAWLRCRLDFRHEGGRTGCRDVATAWPSARLRAIDGSCRPAALADALTTLHSSVPVHEVASPSAAISGTRRSHRDAARGDYGCARDAHRTWSPKPGVSAREWVHSRAGPAELQRRPMSVIFARADGNLANFIFDGHAMPHRRFRGFRSKRPRLIELADHESST